MKEMYKARTRKNKIGTLLPILYDILLLIENDEAGNCKGYNWGTVKSKVTKSSINDSEKGFSLIVSNDGKHTLKLKKIGVLGYKFLKEVRNAFAHNRIVYDEANQIIEFQFQNLQGLILRESFDEIIRLIKESKKQK